ncbi:MAG: hypothetical protein V5A79_01555 [Candidatus Bipolaricaulota bacterium]|nr:hypothetical protein [Candidatus Bipolaricaulota bacterium]
MLNQSVLRLEGKGNFGRKRRIKAKEERKVKRLKRKDEKLNQLKEIVADFKVENDLLKKRRLELSGYLGGKRFSKETKRELIEMIESSQLSLKDTCNLLKLSPRK